MQRSIFEIAYRKVLGCKLPGSYLAKVSKKGLILAVDGVLPTGASLRIGSEIMIGPEKLIPGEVYYLASVSECQMLGKRKYRISIQITGVLKAYELEKDGVSGVYFWASRLDDSDLPPFDFVAYLVELKSFGLGQKDVVNTTCAMDESLRVFYEKYRRQSFRE